MALGTLNQGRRLPVRLSLIVVDDLVVALSLAVNIQAHALPCLETEGHLERKLTESSGAGRMRLLKDVHNMYTKNHT